MTTNALAASTARPGDALVGYGPDGREHYRMTVTAQDADRVQLATTADGPKSGQYATRRWYRHTSPKLTTLPGQREWVAA